MGINNSTVNYIDNSKQEIEEGYGKCHLQSNALRERRWTWFGHEKRRERGMRESLDYDLVGHQTS